jgi:ABC-2 type transport system ATP-binding protein
MDNSVPRDLSLEDAAAARIAVIDHGRKIAEGTNRELKAQIGTGMLHVSLTDPEKLGQASQMLSERLGHPVQRSPEGTELTVIAGDAAAANEAIAALMAAGIEISDFALGQPSLDTVFFALTGHAASDEGEPTPSQDPTP